MSGIRRNMSTPEARAFWESAEKTAAEVRTWPAWRRAGINVEQPGIPNDKRRFFIDHGMVHDRVTGKHVVADEEGCALLNKLSDEASDALALLARGVDLFGGAATTDEVITAICVMIRDRAERHRDPSDPYQTSGTYAAATFAEELADDIANGEWRAYLRSTPATDKKGT